MEDAPLQANGHAKEGSETVAESPQPVVICGPSGVGKGTLIGKLMKEFPDKFGFSVSHTTRNPREKEQDGVHYHFTKRPVMEEEIEDGKFLESAEVHGNLYGTSWAAVNAVSEAGKICILDIDVQGAQSVKKSSLKALFIFIKPPSPEEEELEKRLRGRGTESEEQIQKRLRNARQELERAKDVSLFDRILVNAKLDTAYEQLKALLGLGNPAASAHTNGTAKHLSDPGANSGRSASGNGSHFSMNGGSVPNGPSASTVGAVFDYSDYGGGTPGTTRGSNGVVNGVVNQSKSNGVSKHSKSVPHSYNHNLAILTPSDLLVSMHASAGSPRANGFSIS